MKAIRRLGCMLKKTCFEGIMRFQRFKTLYVPILRVHFEAPLKMIISNANPQILQSNITWRRVVPSPKFGP
jgi:hypothetical protein